MKHNTGLHRFGSRKGRIIVVDGKVWKWQVGRSSVVAHCEDGRRLCDLAANVTHRDFHRGQWKYTEDGMVKPSDINHWIHRNR